MTVGADDPSELELVLLRSSTISRTTYRRAPLWQDGWPIPRRGRLPGGQPWALVFGIDAEGPAADYAVSTSSWKVGVESARHTGTRGAATGEVNHAHGGRARALCWLGEDQVHQLIIDTDQGELNVPVAHHDDQLAMRVFFTVVDDPTVVLQAARHLDHQGRVLVWEDLGWAQQQFEAALAGQCEGPQPGTDVWQARKRAELGPNAIISVFGAPPVEDPGTPEPDDHAR